MNTPSREQRLESILHFYLQAIDRNEKPDRQAILDANPDLRDDLAEYFDDASKLDQMAKSLRTGAFESSDISPSLGRIRYFGDYELLDEIARGGMGVVFKAQQVSLNRTVALKMILKGELASETDVARFRREAEAAGNLDHPHIVPIYEIGEHNGQQYYSMKLIETVKGPDPLTPRIAAERIAKVARAVHHAHQRGLLHRDLKPSNILIDTNGEPHVADFGLAKKVEGGIDATQSGAIVGSPAYMSPEQARSEKSLTTAVDVWSLGAVLYEWLTGRPPFRGDDVVSTLMNVATEDPVSPRSLNTKIDRDLETICLKCLEKDPLKRYGSAAALADDLQRLLNGEPVEARPASSWERAVKWTRRNPAPAAVVGTMVTAGIALLALGLYYNARLQGALTELDLQKSAINDVKTEADHRLAEARLLQQQIAYMGDLDLAHREYKDAWPLRANDILDKYLDTPHCGWEWRYLKRKCRQETLNFTGGYGYALAWSPDGKWIVTGAYEKIEFRDPTTGLVVHQLPHKSYSSGLSFSKDGKILASWGPDVGFTVWDVPTRKQIRNWPYQKNALPYRMDLRPDGKQLASVAGEYTTFWDVTTGKELKSIRYRPGDNSDNQSHRCLAYSPDGNRLAVGTTFGLIVMYDTSTLERVAVFDMQGGFPNRMPSYWVETLVFTPDGKKLLVGDNRGRIHIGVLNKTGVESASTILASDSSNWADVLAVHPNGTRFLSATWDRVIRLWDMKGTLLTSWRGHDRTLRSLAFSPDGKRFVSLDADAVAKVWDAAAPDDAWPAPLTTEGLSDFAFSPNGKWLAMGQIDRKLKFNGVGKPETQWGHVQICDAGTGKVIRSLDKRETSWSSGQTWLKRVAFSPDSKRLATVDVLDNRSGQPKDNNPADTTKNAIAPRTVHVWNIEDGTELFQLRDAGDSVAFSPDGKWIAAVASRPGNKPATMSSAVTFWHAADGKPAFTSEQPTEDYSLLAFSPDGKYLALGGLRVALLEIREDGLKPLTNINHDVDCLTFSPNGKYLAGERRFGRGLVSVWEVPTGKLLHEINQKRNGGGGGAGAYQMLTYTPGRIAFSADSRRLAYATNVNTVRIWDMDVGQDVLVLDDFPTPVDRLFFSKDGHKLYAVDSRPKWHVWDATPLPEEVLYGPSAERLLEKLKTTIALKSEMLSMIKTTEVKEGVRKTALALMANYVESSDRLNTLSWDCVVKPGAAAEAYVLALKQIQRANELDPGNRNVINTLGIALYRVGKYNEALSVLRQSNELHSKMDGKPYVGDLLFLAMTYHHLGKVAEAKKYLEQARVSLKRPDSETGFEEQGFLREAETLITAGVK